MQNDTRDPTHAYVYSYNQTGRLTSATLNGSTVGTYLVNGLEQRVAKTANGTTTHFIFDRLGHLLAEADGATGATLKEYIWLDDLPVAMVDDSGPGPVIAYIHTDHLGTPPKITDGALNIVWDGQFDPFGNPTSITGSVTNNLRFPGQYFDAETGLAQNWNRDYDTTIGRYIESDPIGLDGGINTYSYAFENPLLITDLDGKFALAIPLLPPVFEALGDIAAAAGGAGFGAWLGTLLMTAPGNVGDTEIEGDYNAAASAARLCGQKPPDRCRWLQTQEGAGKYSPARIMAQQKKWGCRPSRARK